MRIFFACMVWALFGAVSPLYGQESENIQWFQKIYNRKPLTKTSDEEIQLLKNARLVAYEEHNPKAEARAMVELAAFYSVHLKNYGDAMDWLIKALAFEDSSKLTHEKALTFVAIARIYEEVGEYEKSIAQLDQAYDVNKESDIHLLLLILNERGRVNAKYGLIPEASADYQQMLSFAKADGLQAEEADALYHLAQQQAQALDYELALKTHKEALAIRRELQNKTKEAESLNSIAQLYLLMKNYERAKANHTVALDIRKKLNNSSSLAESYNNIGTLYIAQKDYKQAINNLQLALRSSQEGDALEQTLRAHESLSLCYKELGDFKNALVHRETYSGIYDLIQQEKNRTELVEIQSRHTIEKQDNKIGKLAADMAERERTIEEQRKQRNFLILIIALGAVIGGLILYLYFIIRKTNKKLKEINETKDKLFSIIGHDLKGPLNSLTAFSSLLIHHAETLTKDEIKMLSGDVDKSLKNLFNLLENLLEWARSQTGNIDFTPTPFDLAAVLKENQELYKGLAEKKKVAIVNKSGASLPVHAHRNSINTVVRNLIGNAIKFTPEGGQIILTAEPAGNQTKVTVTDTGVGMSKEALKRIFKIGTKHSTLGTAQEKGTGLGLILCKDFVEKNGGTIGVESEEGKGSRFFFTVPRLS